MNCEVNCELSKYYCRKRAKKSKRGGLSLYRIRTLVYDIKNHYQNKIIHPELDTFSNGFSWISLSSTNFYLKILSKIYFNIYFPLFLYFMKTFLHSNIEFLDQKIIFRFANLSPERRIFWYSLSWKNIMQMFSTIYVNSK